MRKAALIFFSILLSFTSLRFASAQNHLTSEVTSLRSGNPQRVIDAVSNFEHDSLTRLLYRNLCSLADTNPDTQIQRSRVAKALGFILAAALDEHGTPLNADQKQERRQRLLPLLRSIDPAMGASTDDFQWRAVELMQFAAAYDFYRSAAGRDAETEELLGRFAANAESALNGVLVPRNNLSLKLAAALGYAALVLEDAFDEQIAGRCPLWLSHANDFIASTIWFYQSDESGAAGYSEGPYYFRYAMQNLLPYFIAFDNRASGADELTIGGSTLPNLVRQDRFRRLVDWIIVLRQPDGRLPAFEDTYVDSYFPELALLSQLSGDHVRYAWTNFSEMRSPEQPDRLNTELSRTFDSRVEYILARPTMTGTVTEAPRACVMPEAGYAVFRSAWTQDALYLALIGKHGVARTHRSPIGSGHKQANEGAFIIQAGGTLLAMEPGYHSYDGRDSIVFSDNHNVILVDGEGPDDVSFGTFLFGADAYMEDALTSETLDRVTVRTHYRDADIERSAYFFDDRFIVMHDRLSSPVSRTWTHQVHGNASLDDGFTSNGPEHTASWTNDGMKLTAYVDAAGASATQQAVSRKHSPGYHRYAQHAALYTTVAGKDAAFHSVYIADRATVQPRFTQLYPGGNSSAVRLDMDGSAAVSILQADADGGTVDAGPLGRITSDARLLVHAHYAGGSSEATFAEHVSEIIIDERGMFSADQPVTVSWHSGAGRMFCTVAADAALEYYLRLPYEPKDVSGTGMLSWSMTGNLLRVRMSGTQSDLAITLSSTPTENDSPAAAAQLVLSSIWPNPLDAARHDRLHASMTLDVPGSVELSVWNLIGRRVRTAQGTFLQGGKHMLSVPTTGLPAGMYLLRIKHMAGTIVRPFLIQ